MIRKNKALSRAYLCAYIVWIFGSWLSPLLISKYSGGAAIAFVVIDILSLAALIVSHVFKNLNKKDIFFYTSLPSLCLVVLLSLLGFILELVLTINGQPAHWPWVAGSICLAFDIGVILFYLFGLKKILHPEETV